MAFTHTICQDVKPDIRCYKCGESTQSSGSGRSARLRKTPTTTIDQLEDRLISRPIAALRKIDSLKLHSKVADQLGLAIIRGDFRAGEALPPEVRLCEMLGVSRTAMREAVRGLAAKGLLDPRPKRGTIVRDPEHWNHLDPDLMRWHIEVTDTEVYLNKMFQLRRAAEPEAAALAAVSATEEDKARISRDFQAMVDAGDDDVKWVDADLAFHKSIYLATHNEFFWPIGQLFSLALREMFSILAQGSHRPRAVAEHDDLRRAIVEGKPEMARTAALILLGNAALDVETIRGSGISEPG